MMPDAPAAAPAGMLGYGAAQDNPPVYERAGPLSGSTPRAFRARSHVITVGRTLSFGRPGLWPRGDEHPRRADRAVAAVRGHHDLLLRVHADLAGDARPRLGQPARPG